VTKLGDEHRNFFRMLVDIESDLGDVGDNSRGYRASVDYFQFPRVFQGQQGQMVMAGKVFVYKGESGRSSVDKGMSADLFFTIG